MNKPLTVLITNYNTSDFIEILLYALKKLTKNDYDVFINDNGSTKKHRKKLLQLATQHSNVFLHFRDSKGERGSLAHGRALDSLMPEANSKYTAVFDSDAIVLKKNWDEIFINQLDENVKITGTPLSETVSVDKPYDFPFQFVILFETETFKNLRISWQPKGKEAQAGFDTAWELKPKYTNAGFQGRVLIGRNTRRWKKGPFHELLGIGEYYLHNDKEIFASHFGRGHTLGSAKYRKGTNFIYRIPKVGRILRMARGKQEKKKWIITCRKIIDKSVI